ncbi:hypothetical protein [Desulfurobacterium atlanticum]|uniref:Uncharacterized protein n=1 Tax=Desulfurobacterium atlanticum TaxID=240169 RepID=A0A238Y417_9BACT|nr:hypothetical protein [Desulfurobacterium atlanticum]SNR65531.1 hypothetical protein SAMN06265340_10276 [Desulfurobacterium atlanticum]
MRKKFGVFLAVLVSFLIGIYFAADYYITKKVEEKIDKKLQALKPEFDVKYKNCDVSIFRKSVTLENITVSGSLLKKPLSINKLEVENPDIKGNFPRYARIVVDSVEIPIENFPENLRYILNLLDYRKTISFNTEFSYHFNPEKRRFSLNKYILDVPESGSLFVSLKLYEIPDFKNVSGIESLIFKFLSIKIADGVLIYKDKGFYERAITGIAKYRNLSPVEVKRKIKLKINKELGNDILSLMIKKALIKFIENPRLIKVEIHPDEPVRLGTFLFNSASPEELVNKLGLKVEAD